MEIKIHYNGRVIDHFFLSLFYNFFKHLLVTKIDEIIMYIDYHKFFYFYFLYHISKKIYIIYLTKKSQLFTSKNKIK